MQDEHVRAVPSTRDHEGTCADCICIGAGPALAERHAAVLGLQAFVQLSAYDVPAWLPGILTALASAAVEPAPIRTTVRFAAAA